MAAIDIIAAHLFGVFRNFGLRENALSLSSSVEVRAQSSNNDKMTDSWRESLNQHRKSATSEFDRMAYSQKSTNPNRILVFNSGFGELQIEFSDALQTLASRVSLCLTENEAIEALDYAGVIEEWEMSQTKLSDNEALLQSGIRVRFPFDFGRQ